MEGANGWSAVARDPAATAARPRSWQSSLTVIGALRSFDLISVMSGGGPFESSTVLAYYMYDQAIKYYRDGYSAAIAVVLFAIMLVYIVFTCAACCATSDIQESRVMYPLPVERWKPLNRALYKASLPLALLIWLLPMLAVLVTSIRSSDELCARQLLGLAEAFRADRKLRRRR